MNNQDFLDNDIKFDDDLGDLGLDSDTEDDAFDSINTDDLFGGEDGEEEVKEDNPKQSSDSDDLVELSDEDFVGLEDLDLPDEPEQPEQPVQPAQPVEKGEDTTGDDIDIDSMSMDDLLGESGNKLDLDLEDLSSVSDEDISGLSDDALDALLGRIKESEKEQEEDSAFETLKPEEVADKVDSIDADHDGSILSDDSLLTDSFETVNKDADFVSDTGEIVVMDSADNGDNFRLQYIDIEKIAIVKRIRKNTTNVEDLVQSIKSTGLLEPLVVAPTETEGVYVLLAGFRRIMACAKAGKRRIPCIVNIKASTPEIPVLEALYNHSKSYTIREIVDYIDYLEKQKGIMSASMIEYLLQLNSGDYTKLKDILNDNDDDIVSKLFDGIYTIEVAFKKLEQRRKKESAEEKENKKAARVYEDEAESGADNIAGSGEETDDDEALSEEEIKSMAFSAGDLDNVDDEDFTEIEEEGKNVEGFKPHKQDYKERERLAPELRKAVLSRDKNTCQICKIISGMEFTEVLDVHHIVEVYLGGDDNIDNLITACTVCHKLIHLYGRGDLYIRPIEELTEQEQARFKRIMKLGTVIRKGLAAKGLKREQLKKLDAAETIGRTKPGTGQVAG